MAAGHLAWSSVDDGLFRRSLTPMLVVDGDRRCVDANAASCLFLRQPIEAVRRLTIDDLTVPQPRLGVDTTWSLLLRGNSAIRLPQDMRMPDGTRVAVELSATPDIAPGRHLVFIGFPAARADARGAHAAPPPKTALTRREREILTLVALGATGVEIAGQLFLSPATVQTHVVNALTKLNAKNRAHGIALALQSNELDLEAVVLGRVGCPPAHIPDPGVISRSLSAGDHAALNPRVPALSPAIGPAATRVTRPLH